MNRIIVSALTFVLLVGCIALAGPRIEVDSATYEFGSKVEGVVITHTFVITNSGNQTLTISRVYTSCGCTTTGLPKKNLAPGESVNLDAVFDTVGYGGRTVTKTIYVESDDPKTPKLVLQMRGTVRQTEAYNITCGDLSYLFYLLIDIREPDLYAKSHILGAINIPYQELGEWIERLPSGVLIILYDQDGTRSDEAAQMLNRQGLSEAKSLLGGLEEWRRAYNSKFLFLP
jgi:rhodanese-related sulfurtransferase